MRPRPAAVDSAGCAGVFLSGRGRCRFVAAGGQRLRRGAGAIRRSQDEDAISTRAGRPCTAPIRTAIRSPVDWEQAKHVEWAPEMLERDVPDGVTFAALPAPALKAKNYDAWSKQLAASIAAGEGFEVFRSPSTGEVSRPGEAEREFRARIQQASRESRDRAMDAVRKKYAPRQAALDEKLRRAQQTVGPRDRSRRPARSCRRRFRSARRSSARCSARKSDQCRNHRPGDDRGAWLRAVDEGIAGRRASAGHGRCRSTISARRSRMKLQRRDHED